MAYGNDPTFPWVGLGPLRPVLAFLGLIILLLGILFFSMCGFSFGSAYCTDSHGVTALFLIILGAAMLGFVGWLTWKVRRRGQPAQPVGRNEGVR